MKKRVMPEAPPDHVLRIDDQTWQGLEKNLGCSLEKWERDEITAATDQFIMAQYFLIIGKAQRQLRGSRSKPTNISKLRTNLVRVLKNWDDIQNDPTAQQFLEDVSNDLGLSDVDDVMLQLQFLNARIDPYLDQPEKNPFIHYVKRISLVYEKVTGEPVTITNPAYENQKVSTFVEVMKVLNTALPEYAQQDLSTDSAWAQALILAREV